MTGGRKRKGAQIQKGGVPNRYGGQPKKVEQSRIFLWDKYPDSRKKGLLKKTSEIPLCEKNGKELFRDEKKDAPFPSNTADVRGGRKEKKQHLFTKS